MENPAVDKVELPYMRAELIATLKGLAATAVARRMWVEEQPSRYFESLDQDFRVLEDSNLADDPFSQIGPILRNTREAAAMQALNEVLGPVYDPLPYPFHDHAALLAVPEWQHVV